MEYREKIARVIAPEAWEELDLFIAHDGDEQQRIYWEGLYGGGNAANSALAWGKSLEAADRLIASGLIKDPNMEN